MTELDEKLAADDTTPRQTTTTAPEGADIDAVRAGMQIQEGNGPMGYAPSGSLAKEKEKEKGGKGGERTEEEERAERILKEANVY